MPKPRRGVATKSNEVVTGYVHSWRTYNPLSPHCAEGGNTPPQIIAVIMPARLQHIELPIKAVILRSATTKDLLRNSDADCPCTAATIGRSLRRTLVRSVILFLSSRHCAEVPRNSSIDKAISRY